MSRARARELEPVGERREPFFIFFFFLFQRKKNRVMIPPVTKCADFLQNREKQGVFCFLSKERNADWSREWAVAVSWRAAMPGTGTSTVASFKSVTRRRCHSSNSTRTGRRDTRSRSGCSSET